MKANTMPHSHAQHLRAALAVEKPLQIVGAINAYAALLAEQSGFRALYLSGGGVAAASCGLPDLGIIALEDVLIETRRISEVCSLPLLVDIDTGWGGAFNIARAIRSLEKAGAAAIHLEDQVQQKRCGHRPNKTIVSPAEMVDRIKAACDARHDTDFIIMARTDALALEGLEGALERAALYVAAGADMIFPEAVTKLDMYPRFATRCQVPILANMTEFGQTELYDIDTLKAAEVSLVLYPLSAFRAMSKAARQVYNTIRQQGTQRTALAQMQTREELYECLGYQAFEHKLDELFNASSIVHNS